MSIDPHSHASLLVGGRLTKEGLDSASTTSLSGTLAGGPAYVTCSPDMFWPMFHGDVEKFFMISHNVDGGSADAPRFGIYAAGSSVNYDIDYRFIST